MPEDNVYSAKREIRKRIIRGRLGLSDAEVSSMSRSIAGNMFKYGMFDGVRTAFVFKSFKNEVDTSFIIDGMKAGGIKTCFPRIEEPTPGQKVMSVYTVSGGDECFVRSAYGILEPDPDSRPGKCALIKDIKDIDLVIVPGVAYDKRFNRIGYGGGFYDRFLAGVRPDCLKAAPAFSMQIVEEAPANQNDVPVDCIITEGIVYLNA